MYVCITSFGTITLSVCYTIAIANQYTITLRQIVMCFVAEIIAINRSINFYLLVNSRNNKKLSYR